MSVNYSEEYNLFDKEFQQFCACNSSKKNLEIQFDTSETIFKLLRRKPYF